MGLLEQQVQPDDEQTKLYNCQRMYLSAIVAYYMWRKKGSCAHLVPSGKRRATSFLTGVQFFCNLYFYINWSFITVFFSFGL